MFDIPNWGHYNPVRIVCAPLETLAQYVKPHHVLLVTTPGFLKRGVVQRVKDILSGHQVTVWDGVKPNSDLQDLDAASANLRGLGVECVVGLGGGSALDAAKVLSSTIPGSPEISLRQVFSGAAASHWVLRLPLIAIPTTSGTGAEVTPFATVWDHAAHKKHSLAGEFVYPDLALLDATLTLSLGEEDTLYPALDAFSHALESLWNKNHTPVSRAYAFQALALSNAALPQVMHDFGNLGARRDLQTASILAGLAISQTRTAIAHSISYPLTSHFGVPHGLACSFTLPALLQKNISTLAHHSGEQRVLNETLKIIEALDLRKRIATYANPQQLVAVSSEMFTPGRADNYAGQSLGDLTILLKDD